MRGRKETPARSPRVPSRYRTHPPSFCFADYQKAQSLSTKWIANRSVSLIELIRSRIHPSSNKWKKASLTAKSYIFQEAEATARCAKIAALTEKHIPIYNLQHDGIIAGVTPLSVDEWATSLSKSATTRCNLPVTVQGEWN